MSLETHFLQVGNKVREQRVCNDMSSLWDHDTEAESLLTWTTLGFPLNTGLYHGKAGKLGIETSQLALQRRALSYSHTTLGPFAAVPSTACLVWRYGSSSEHSSQTSSLNNY